MPPRSDSRCRTPMPASRTRPDKVRRRCGRRRRQRGDDSWSWRIPTGDPWSWPRCTGGGPPWPRPGTTPLPPAVAGRCIAVPLTGVVRQAPSAPPSRRPVAQRESLTRARWSGGAAQTCVMKCDLVGRGEPSVRLSPAVDPKWAHRRTEVRDQRRRRPCSLASPTATPKSRAVVRWRCTSPICAARTGAVQRHSLPD